MVLLIPYPMTRYRMGYTEFTFHYGSTYTKTLPRREILRKEFTFHYGSTYTKRWHARKSLWYAFTFHYGSTYTRIRLILVHFLRIYLHSTMVLLIQDERASRGGNPPDLHSTMVLLIPTGGFKSLLSAIFTFHYGSTYTAVYPMTLCHFLIIYIPLWFYLYITNALTLRPGDNIYIPLWFYLYDKYDGKHRPIVTIYIPLWFYLYNCLLRVFCTCSIFTFHYGSTYTGQPEVFAGIFILFTFHYGSTYTECKFCTARQWLYLHSTMVLLIQIFSFVIRFLYCIYIPLWFYLYWTPDV